VLEASARASLRSAIWPLRAALGPDLGSCLATDRETVTLAGGGLWVDLREVRRLIAQGQSEAALDLCRGDLLQELDDDWVVGTLGYFLLLSIWGGRRLRQRQGGGPVGYAVDRA
jgi:DNA-binding SARP family transcriptional activator